VINDSLGHIAGDELLVAVARRLADAVRRQDTVARLGGDEFVILCENLADEKQAEELAERAADALIEPFMLERGEVVVTASIGIAVTRNADLDAATFLRDADSAMYRAKGLGGARHELFDEEMHTRAVERLLTEQALRRAIENDELSLASQPQFDLRSGAVVGSELLLRWRHPTRGVVPASEFL